MREYTLKTNGLIHPADTGTGTGTGTTLRPAVLADASALPASARREIVALSGARPGRFAAELGFTWLSIAGLIAAGVHFDNLAVSLLCAFLVGTRQMVLALLLHEQVHRLGLRSKYADWIINVFAVFPLFFTTVEDYAKVHLSHHKYCFTKDDPDFLRKSGAEWTYPMTRRQLHCLARWCRSAHCFVHRFFGRCLPAVAQFAPATS